MANELSGQFVYFGALKIVEFFTLKIENARLAHRRDMDAMAADYISVPGKSPILPPPSAAALPPTDQISCDAWQSFSMEASVRLPCDVLQKWFGLESWQ
jgi:hypothetical protein